MVALRRRSPAAVGRFPADHDASEDERIRMTRIGSDVSVMVSCSSAISGRGLGAELPPQPPEGRASMFPSQHAEFQGSENYSWRQYHTAHADGPRGEKRSSSETERDSPQCEMLLAVDGLGG